MTNQATDNALYAEIDRLKAALAGERYTVEDLLKSLTRIQCAADNRGVDNPSDSYIRSLCYEIAACTLSAWTTDEQAPVNADGDTLADIKAVWERFGGSGICSDVADQFPYAAGTDWPVIEYRWPRVNITAKHADTFDRACMDFEAWARAAIGRGMVLSQESDVEPFVCDNAEQAFTVYSGWGDDFKWTAITYEQETAPAHSLDCAIAVIGRHGCTCGVGDESEVGV